MLVIGQKRAAKKNSDEGLPQFFASNQLSASIPSHNGLDHILTQAVQQIKKTFKIRSCCIFLVNDKGILKFKKGSGLSNHFQKIFNSPMSSKPSLKILKSIYPKISNDTLKNYKKNKSLYDLMKRENIHKEISVPLKVKNRLIGVLNIGRDSSCPDFSERDLSLLKTIGNQITMAINNAELYHQLQKSSELYSNLIEGAPVSIVAVDLKGNITSCNKATEILTGYTKEELIGKHFGRVGSIKNKELLYYSKLFKELLSGKRLAPFEMEVTHKDGKSYWVEVHVSRIKAKEKITGFQVNATDITERKQAERALIRKEKIATERARLLNDLRSFNKIDDILTRVCQAVRDSGLFERAVMTLHRPGGKIVNLGSMGLPRNVVARARKAPPIDGKLRSQMTNPKFRISDSFFIPVEVDLDYTKTKRYVPQKKKGMGEGDWRPGDELFVPLRDFPGEVMGYLSVDTPTDGCRPDVKTIQTLETFVEAAAARVREVHAQEALRESEEKFRSLAEQSPNMIFIYRRGRVIYANRKCEEIMGYKRGEFYAPDFDFLTLIDPEDRELVKASLKRHIMGKEVLPYEYAIITKEGKKIEAILSTKLISYRGEDAVLGIITDITERKRAEEEIRKFKAISDRARYGSAISDLEGNLIYINESFAQMHGYKAEELIGKNLSVFHTKEQMKDVERFNKQLIQKGSYIAEEVWHKRKDGIVFPTLMSLTTVEDEKCKPLFMAATAIDITDRKRVEESLRESENKYRGLIENLPQKIFLKDKNSVYVSCNENYARDLKIKPEGIAGKTDYDFYPRELAEKYRGDDQRIMRSGNTEDIEERYIQNGRELWVHTVKTPVKDEKGQCVGLLGIFRDITERKRAEENLRKTKEFSDNLIVSMQDGFSVVDSNGVHIKVNPALCKMTGFSREELIGVGPPHPYWPPEEYEEIGGAFQKTLRGEFDSFELTFMRKSGERFPIIISPSCVRDEHGNIISHVATIKDITERKRMEEALRESQERYRSLFEDSPISLWEEDFSKVKMFIDRLRAKGVKDLRKYFEDHPKAVVNCANRVKVNDVNNASLELFKANHKDELQRGLGSTFSEESYDAFREELIAIAFGKTTYESEAITQTLKGDKKHVFLRWSVAPGYEKTLSKVLVSISDVTELKRAKEQSLLLETSKALSRTLKLDQVLKIATEKMAKALKADRCAVALFDESSESALIKHMFIKKDSPSPILPDKPTPPDDHFSETKEILLAKGYFEIKNTETDPLPPSVRSYFRRVGIKSFLIIPLVVDKKLFGVFHVGSVENLRSFTSEDISLVQTIANQVVVSIQNCRLMQELERKHSQISEQADLLRTQYGEQKMLFELAQALSSTLDLDQMLKFSTQKVTELLRTERSSILLINPDGESATIKAIYLQGKISNSDMVGFTFDFKVFPELKKFFARPEPFVIADISALPKKDPKRAYFLMRALIKSTAAVPLKSRGKLLGLLTVATIKKVHHYTPEELQLLQTVANSIAVSIENAGLLELLTKSSEDLKTLSLQLINVQEDERKKIAQELHDQIGQTLFAMKMNLEITRKHLPSDMEELPDIKNRLTETEDLLSQTIEQTRDLTTALRPSMLDDFGLISALNSHIGNFSKRTNIRVSLRTKNFKERLSPEIETLLYRIAQEALTNVAKHSQATEVSILLGQQNSFAYLSVKDNGIGFDTKGLSFPKDRLGLFSIKERVKLLKGEFEIHSKPNKGTKLNVKIPLSVPINRDALKTEKGEYEKD